MDAVEISRLQFAVTGSVHYLFVTLSLGLVLFVVAFQTLWTIRKNPAYERMTKFWGRLYVINYGAGIIGGLVMEFQFGLNWSGLVHATGNVFGGLIAIETLVAFFIEATFLGMWIFGWGRIPRVLHLGLIWVVAATAYVSAYWILAANAFLQHPVGYEMRDGVAFLTDFSALLRNPNLVDALLHIVSAAVVTGALFVAGVSAWQFLRRTPDVAEFRRSLRFAVVALPLGVYPAIHFGFLQEVVIEQSQPAKLAAIYADPERSLRVQRELAAQFGPGDWIPPDWVSVPYQIMMQTTFGLALVSITLLVLLTRDWLVRLRVPLYVLVGLIPVPFVLVVCGWLVREVGRQPWAVYGLLSTTDAASPLSTGAAAASFAGFSVLLGGLVLLNVTLLWRFARRGIEDDALGMPLGAALGPSTSDDDTLLVGR
ncbi:cytochrome ubiquinol oxidase subunit I [Micromonospora maris]|uniref:Cytochrome BD oxidase subunit I n=1 Tax=Micromonospora maris TaxID=1003110 RepID=A0A9X0HZW7_9ACTN|nr:cytochrome ubiquinol oxidase subunit I [Micromonospora maris]AEB44724.1 cytochrome d ubiquinol oxidase subunit I [Micromonospora maris AB-18-032]KUJ44208.1 cytochrome BD oxidase subunit I [Micromonospora maris]